MWAVLKYDKKYLHLLNQDLRKKLGNDFQIYIPKIRIQKYKNNKLINKEFNLLGDYIFCFHKNLVFKNTLNTLKYSRGLKYILEGFSQSQKEINEFIIKCKNHENTDGIMSRDFFDLQLDKKYKFGSGPFTDKFFKIIQIQKENLKILLGNIKTTIKKKEFIFIPE